LPPQKHPRKRIPSPAWLISLAPILGPLAGVRQDFPFAVSLEAAAFPFRGWRMERGGEQVASWRVDGDATTESVPGWEVLWEARNASGTDMRITIRDLRPSPDPAANCRKCQDGARLSRRRGASWRLSIHESAEIDFRWKVPRHPGRRCAPSSERGSTSKRRFFP